MAPGGGPRFAVRAADNMMPYFGAAEGLTLEQVRDVSAFLMSGPKVGDYATINPAVNPVAYTFTGASVANGTTLYAAKCSACHATIDAPIPGSATTLRTYFGSDGKFSEGFHKSYYGIPGTIMTPAAVGSPSGAEVADILAYIQSLLP